MITNNIKIDSTVYFLCENCKSYLNITQGEKELHQKENGGKVYYEITVQPCRCLEKSNGLI